MLAAALLVVAALAAPHAGKAREPDVRKAETLVVGEGLGQWRIDMTRVVRPGLLRTVRYPKNDHDHGCVSFVPHESDSVVDHYAGLRLAWIRNDRGALLLHGIATTRPGDRTRRGFSIGLSTLAEVRRGFANESVEAGAELAHWGPRPPRAHPGVGLLPNGLRRREHALLLVQQARSSYRPPDVFQRLLSLMPLTFRVHRVTLRPVRRSSEEATCSAATR